MNRRYTFREFTFILPALLIIGIFLLTPVIINVFLSFQKDGSFSLGQYTALFQRARFLQAFKNNTVWILLHLPFTTMVGLGFALLLSQSMPGRGVLRTILFMGMIIPMVVGGMLVRFLFSHNSGMISSFFGWIGWDSLNVNWIADVGLALPALVATSLWLWAGYSMIMYLSALTAIPTSLQEAAQIDGASSFQCFLYILLPFLKPVTGVIITMTIIWELKLFDIVYASTGGGPGGRTNLLALEMYSTSFREGDINKGSAIAVVMALLSLGPIIYFVRSQLKEG